jgi:hypothetical protein
MVASDDVRQIIDHVIDRDQGGACRFCSIKHHLFLWQISDIINSMSKSIRDIKKSDKPKVGRPKTTGPGLPLIVRMHDRQISAVDGWIATQDDNVSRPEAIRRLVDLALESAKKGGKGGR